MLQESRHRAALLSAPSTNLGGGCLLTSDASASMASEQPDKPVAQVTKVQVRPYDEGRDR